ncbi:MAG: hypothetical protein H7249_10330 [Chitinophagaceae bacterium]|nr:hypothetical protein [Oligoflexus sp.]
MSENNQDPNSNAAFSQTSGAQSNPFTSELKGEFTSDFGTNTNAVSAIFKSGGMGESKSKLIVGGVLLLGILVGGYLYFDGGSESGEETAAEDAAAPADDAGDDAKPADGAKATAESKETAKPAEAAKPAATAAAAAASTGAIKLLTPGAGGSQTYDETQGVSEFAWEGPADEIVFSRNKSMAPVIKSVKLNGASKFSFENPYPGTWYWQVKNASGASDVSSFVIAAPEHRSFPVSAPTPGGSVAGNGGVVSWTAAEKVARYSVEFTPTGSSFANPSYRFGTSGTSVSLSGVNPGSYDVRVGAFSEVAGRWEWQVIQNVSVQ